MAQGGKGQILVAGAGNETLSAFGSSGQHTLFGGSGRDLMIGGSGRDTLVAGGGNETMTGGKGADTFTFVQGHADGTVLISDFGAMDQIDLLNYGRNEIANALKTQHATNGAATLTLSDNTTLTFTGVSSLDAHDFTQSKSPIVPPTPPH